MARTEASIGRGGVTEGEQEVRTVKCVVLGIVVYRIVLIRRPNRRIYECFSISPVDVLSLLHLCSIPTFQRIHSSHLFNADIPKYFKQFSVAQCALTTFPPLEHNK